MEIEIDKKSLLKWLVLGGLIVVLLAGLLVGGSTVGKAVGKMLHGKTTAIRWIVGKESPTPTPSAPSEETGKNVAKGSSSVGYRAPGKPTIVFTDLSSRWDWTIDEKCLPKLADWIQQDKWLKGHKIKKITIGLVDEKAPEKMRLGPRGEEYSLGYAAGLPPVPTGAFDYQANADCIQDKEVKGEIRCYVTPVAWKEVNNALSVVTIVAPLSALEQILRPKTRDAWREYAKDWAFENYKPLVRREGDKWYTDCLRVRPQG